MSDTQKSSLFILRPVGLWVAIWLTACLVTGCVNSQPLANSDSSASHVNRQNPEPDPRIAVLLAQARDAFSRDHLTMPLDDNAYLRFHQVLSIDPYNADANRGIADIVEKYLEWAVAHARRGNMRSAADYLGKARSVDETHPNIETVSALISRLVSTRGERHPINLDADPSILSAQLTELATMIDRASAPVIIRALNDRDGRWIYQQLNNATRGRLRATFERSGRPEVVIRY